MDVEFAVQYLVLAHAAAHPELLDNAGNIALLQRAEAAGLLPAGVGRAAADAYRELRRAQHQARLDEQPTHFDPDSLAAAARRRAGPVAGRLRLTRRRASPGLALAALLAAGSMLAWWAPATLLDWQPALAASEPWRAWSAAFVHWSALHLGANLGAAAAVAAFGWAARVPPRATLAWGVAWPLTHLGLLLRPELAHYGGLSGVLHGGVAVVVLWLLVSRRGARGAPSAPWSAPGCVAKLWLEQPWGPVLRHAADWDIAVAPLAHATGALAGLLCGACWRCGAVGTASDSSARERGAATTLDFSLVRPIPHRRPP